jgi:acyl carrier protein
VYETIIAIIIDEVTELLSDTEPGFTGQVDEKTRLYGENGVLDSMGLVNLTVAVEEQIAERFSKSIILADERAMSMRLSPFSRVNRLARWVETLMEEV